jgi:hypothetical protein
MRPGASHGLIASLDALAARPGHQLTYPVGWRWANASAPRSARFPQTPG